MVRKRKRRRNPDGFTTDEAQTAARLVDEGYNVRRQHRHPYIGVKMCDREAPEPVERVFGTRIYPVREKTVTCPPHLFPPDGKGSWVIEKGGKPAKELIERLKPLLTKEFIRKHEANIKRCSPKEKQQT